MRIFLVDVDSLARFRADMAGLHDRIHVIGDVTCPANAPYPTAVAQTVSRDGLKGYVEVEVLPDDQLSIRLRDTDTSPPQDDLALVEPPRRDRSNQFDFGHPAASIRQAIGRWAAYGDASLSGGELVAYSAFCSEIADRLATIANSSHGCAEYLAQGPGLHWAGSVSTPAGRVIRSDDIDHYLSILDCIVGNDAVLLHTAGSACSRWSFLKPNMHRIAHRNVLDPIEHMRELVRLSSGLRRPVRYLAPAVING